MVKANQTIDGLEKRNEKFEKENDLLTQSNSLTKSIIEKQSQSSERKMKSLKKKLFF